MTSSVRILSHVLWVAVLELASNSYLNHRVDAAPLEAFVYGFVPEVQPVPNMIARPTEVATLSRLIKDQVAKQYFLVVGEHGNGKTTLICQVLNPDNIPKLPRAAQDTPSSLPPAQSAAINSQSPPSEKYNTCGCVYIEIPPTATNITTNDGHLLGDIFGIENRKRGIVSNAIYGIARYFSNYVPQTTRLNLEDVLKVIEKAAQAYRNLYGKIPILVIDNINVLATCSPAYLNILQKQAKSWADKSILTVVFVASDGAAPPLMKRDSASSCAEVFVVQGVSNVDAVRYLKALGFESELAEKVVQDLTGGKLVLLNAIKNASDSSYEEIETKIFSRVRDALENLQNSSADEVGEKVIDALLKSENKQISIVEFRKLIADNVAKEVRNQTFETLAQTQVISIMGDEVGFQYAATLTYLLRNNHSM